ncbi:MAG: ABC transporter substrate-binding protein [Oscillospiraceae bacterium]
MKTTKKLVAFILSVAMMCTFTTGCSSKTNMEESSKQTEKVEKTEQTEKTEQKKIGIIQFVEHEALDQAYKGFIDGLKEEGFVDGENIKIDYKNAQGEMANCSTIATKLINDKNDLILAIATPAAQAMANATKDIPILVTAVTDPEKAQLVKSNTAPGGNVTGTSDMTPVAKQLNLLKQLVPNAKKIGLMYSSNEANSTIQIEIAKAEAEKLGLETIDATVSATNELQQVAQSLVGKVDAIYLPTDNMMATGMATISMVTEPAKIPVICGEEALIANGALATYGINYYNLGVQTGKQAAKILRGEAKPADMPIEYIEETNLTIDLDRAEKLGITVSDELKAQLKK